MASLLRSVFGGNKTKQEETKTNVKPENKVPNNDSHHIREQKHKENKHDSTHDEKYQKSESYPSSDSDSEDDQYQETIVTGNDGRRMIDVFKPESDDIYPCIAQLDMEYDYYDTHRYRAHSIGTGTVVFVGNKNENKHKLGYILTCAHNLRLSLIHCTRAKCDTYRQKRDSNGHKTECVLCGESVNGAKQEKILVKATKIVLRDRSIEYSNYGQTLENYDCFEIYVSDNKYYKYHKPKHGFDWAYLAFEDRNGIYEKRLQTISIELENGMSVFNEKTNKTFCIFGYPCDKRNEMFGMKSDKSNRFETHKNEKTEMSYLYQTGIDTKEGQSGSIVWFKHENKTKICAIHVGGSKGTKENNFEAYNIGTLINAQMREILKQIKRNNKMIGIQLSLDRIGVTDIDFKVFWDNKNKICNNSENRMELKVQIKEFNQYLFVDKECEFKGNAMVTNINGLAENTQYCMRVKCISDDSKESKYVWNDAIITSFKTNEWSVTFLDKSKIITDTNELQTFTNLLKQELKGKYELKLLYRSKEQNSDKDSAAFHDLCDGKGSTLTIIETEHKHIFGGYANVPWTSEYG